MEKKKNNTELDLDEDGIPKLEYIQVGEFLLPNLSLEKVDGYIGRWGIMRKEYLQKHKPAVYSSMLLMDELNQHLIDIQIDTTMWIRKIISIIIYQRNASSYIPSMLIHALQ